MPFITRDMVKYMQKEGISEADSDDDKDDSPKNGSNAPPSYFSKGSTAETSSSGNSSSDAGKKKKKRKIREEPVNMDAISKACGPPKSKEESHKEDKSGKAKGAKSKARSKSRSSSKSSNASSAESSTKHSKSKASVKTGGSCSEVVQLAGFDQDGGGKMSFEKRTVLYIQSLIQSHVKRLEETKASLPIDANREAFQLFTINKSVQVAPARTSKAIYEAEHAKEKGTTVVCKLYEELDANNSTYLKILNHLGKKHPNIVQTWAVFADDSLVYVFQELAPYRDLATYMERTLKGALSEKRAQEVGRQLRNAMDYLGDMGVCHLNIAPQHVLVMHATKEMLVKLSGFMRAVIYYNTAKNNIRYQPCEPAAEHTKHDFRAPEIFGDPLTEEYDPTTADVWSYGATIYYSLASKYPYEAKHAKRGVHLEEVIQRNVRSLKVAKAGHNMLGLCLTTLSTKRCSVDKLAKHPWLVDKD